MTTPVQTLYDKTSIALKSQRAFGFAMPPFIPLKQTVRVIKNAEGGYDFIELAAGKQQTHTADADLQNRLKKGLVSRTNFIVPVTLITDTITYTFPLDPIISLQGKNIIVRRYVSKRKYGGSIKERWSQDDWELTISGTIIGEAEHVGEHVKTIHKICSESKQGVEISCDFINDYVGINRIAIESFDFPFTKGVENQDLIIKAYSDDVYNLLIES